MLSAPPGNRYERLVAVLERYISRSTVSAMLRSVIADREIEPAQMSTSDLVAVVEEVMIGLRLFCTPRRLPDLMIELAELCDAELACEQDEEEEHQSEPPLSSRAARPRP
jgi:hypothetical protein